MDKRKLQQIEKDREELEQEEYIEKILSVQDIVNSKKVNEALIESADEMFTFEFLLK